MRCLLSLLLIFLIPYCLVAQEQLNNQASDIIQVSGVVIHGDTIAPLPYVNIGVLNTNRGTTSNYEGFFSIAIRRTDTLIFSAIGFQRSWLTIPTDLESERYSVIQTLETDTIQLPESVIYPWPSKEEFKQAFLDLDIPDDQVRIAQKNLEREKIRDLAKVLPLDGREAAVMSLRNQSKQYIYIGQYPANNLLNPFAWVRFFKMLKEGKLKLEKD